MMSSPPFTSIAQLFSDLAEPARFPDQKVRYRADRWAREIGLDGLSDADWVKHFAGFAPLPGNLQTPRAIRYHGHQFHVYNPDLGDGRGFLFAQLQDQAGRWLDLGTKGSGQTRWSRQGDGRLTLKGGVREILAANYLEAFGVKTSKPFSLIETGEALHRNDEPSPARSSVLTRLSHSHIRFGTFQRAAYEDNTDAMAALAGYCARYFYPGHNSDDPGALAVHIFEKMVVATGRMIGQWMATGFVHGVMNTDNFNITGETFDFGPWRFLETSDPNFTAAYFDHQGLYRFGRQPTQGLWALQQLGASLSLLANTEALSACLQRYEAAFQTSFVDHTHLLLGLNPNQILDEDIAFLQTLFGWMTETGANWPQFFFDWFCGPLSQARAARSPQSALYEAPEFEAVRAGLLSRRPDRPERLDHAYFQADQPVTLLIDEVEGLWAPIHERDDWSALDAKLHAIEQAREAYQIAFEIRNPGV